MPENLSLSVSVVIPTYKRHQEVLRAVRSALSQSFEPIEIIVVNDGPDEEKGRLLASITDHRLRYIEAPRSGKPSATRNYGVSVATGEWIALLDDDDIWMRSKLADQAAAVHRTNYWPLVVSGIEKITSTEGWTRWRPSKMVSSVTNVGELMYGDTGGIHTSTILAPRELFIKCPFDESLSQFEDHQWLLDVEHQCHAKIVIVPEVVCEQRLGSVQRYSSAGDFNASRNWYQKNRELLSQEARAAFVAKELSGRAAHDWAFGEIPWIVRELMANRSKASKILLAMRPWVVPKGARTLVKRVMSNASR